MEELESFIIVSLAANLYSLTDDAESIINKDKLIDYLKRLEE